MSGTKPYVITVNGQTWSFPAYSDADAKQRAEEYGKHGAIVKLHKVGKTSTSGPRWIYRDGKWSRENPALGVLGNPPASWSKRVYAIQYRHAEDGKDYEHEFAPGVSLRANRDGTVTLYRPDGLPVWEEF